LPPPLAVATVLFYWYNPALLPASLQLGGISGGLDPRGAASRGTSGWTSAAESDPMQPAGRHPHAARLFVAGAGGASSGAGASGRFWLAFSKAPGALPSLTCNGGFLTSKAVGLIATDFEMSCVL